MNIKNLAIAVVLGFTSSIANAATIWLPTSKDTEFLVLDFANIDLNGASLALFDNSDVDFLEPLFIGNGVGGLGTGGGHVEFNPPPPASGDVTVTSYDANGDPVPGPFGTLVLSDSHEFVLAVTRNRDDVSPDWLSDTDWTRYGDDTYLIEFAEHVECGPTHQGGNCYRKAKVLGVDLQPIPVPPAVWLFGSGLLGLVAVARRRA